MWRSLSVGRFSCCGLAIPLVVLVASQVFGAEGNSGASKIFTLLSPDETGVEFVNPILPDHELNALYSNGHCCGGVSIADLDNDGRLDLFCVGGPESNGLYLQDQRHALKFHHQNGVAVEGGDNWGTGAAIVDIDGDGDKDIYVCNYDSPNQLFINRSTPGKPHFTEEAAAYGLDVRDSSMMMTFADIDNDGDLDAYLLCNVYYSEKMSPGMECVRLDEKTGQYHVLPKFERYFQVKKSGPEIVTVHSYGRADYLFMNEGADENGQIRFRDITKKAGIQGFGYGLSATWLDYDDDGWIDLYVANDFISPDRFYRNLGPGKDGVVRFANVIADTMPCTTWSSMGADVGDFNNDGHVDLLVADMAASTHYKAKVSMGSMSGPQRKVLETDWPRQAMRNMLFINTGVGVFQEAGYLAGVTSSDWTWAVKAADYDLDGRTDVLLVNGMTRNYVDSDHPRTSSAAVNVWEHFRDEPPLREQNRAFRNVSDLHFEDVSKDWGFDKVGVSFSCAHGDLDNDGDLELIVSNLDEPVSIYRNDASGNWLTLRLKGQAANLDAIGAVVRVETKTNGTLVRTLNPWTGWSSTNDAQLAFGLGEDDAVESIEIRWPNNQVTRLGATKANQHLVVEQKEALERPLTHDSPMFVNAPEYVGPRFKHEENQYDDFKTQPLLPGKLSAFGPCMAWGDANGDDLPDVFVGGAKGQAGELWINDGGGKFLRVAASTFAEHADMEDSAASWLDIDGDGDQDLMVASGSVEFPAGDPMYRNRLYVNRGVANDRMTPLFYVGLDDATNSSSTVATSDFDRDGDLDLFIGSRSVPGEFPVTPESQLMINESRGGEIHLSDGTESHASDLKLAGLVTGAVWADVDGDGWDDLLVSTEWGPIKLWHNEEGKLVEATSPAGLGKRTGWWYGLRTGDVDRDGDLDVIGFNVGLNTKYGHASAKKPAILYYGDMDDSGTCHLVEAKSVNGQLLPVRGRSCSSQAMPFIKEKFGTYREFALADLMEIYTPNRLGEAIELEANTFESGVWLNNSSPGKPSFEFVPFPHVAQISPVYGAAIADFDADGNPDVFLAQNHFHREPETGVWRGGCGQLLSGHGDGRFTAVLPAESGIVLRGDATGAEAMDIDGDGDSDIVATQNNDRLQVFLNVQN